MAVVARNMGAVITDEPHHVRLFSEVHRRAAEPVGRLRQARAPRSRDHRVRGQHHGPAARLLDQVARRGRSPASRSSTSRCRARGRSTSTASACRWTPSTSSRSTPAPRACCPPARTACGCSASAASRAACTSRPGGARPGSEPALWGVAPRPAGDSTLAELDERRALVADDPGVVAGLDHVGLAGGRSRPRCRAIASACCTTPSRRGRRRAWRPGSSTVRRDGLGRHVRPIDRPRGSTSRELPAPRAAGDAAPRRRALHPAHDGLVRRSEVDGDSTRRLRRARSEWPSPGDVSGVAARTMELQSAARPTSSSAIPPANT